MNPANQRQPHAAQRATAGQELQRDHGDQNKAPDLSHPGGHRRGPHPITPAAPQKRPQDPPTVKREGGKQIEQSEQRVDPREPSHRRLASGPFGRVDVPKGRGPTLTAPGADAGTAASQLGELLREQMDDVARAAVAKARSSPQPGQVQKGGAGSTNLQAGGDIRIDGYRRRRRA